MTFSNITLFITSLFTGLIAGLFFAYSCSVTLAFKTLPDREYIAAMQSINKAIQNPVFFLVFMGLVILLPLNAYLQYRAPGFSWFLAAAILYLIGTFGVTVAGNVPLNNMLETFALNESDPSAMRTMRMAFEGKWNMLNDVRTVASIAAFGVLIVGLMKRFNLAD